jgi:hypothetical protein
MSVRRDLLRLRLARPLSVASFAVFSLVFAGLGHAADTIGGQVLGAGAPIAKSTVTLWSASADEPKQLAKAQTDDDGGFTLSFEGSNRGAGVLYIIAKGGAPRHRRTVATTLASRCSP